VYNMSKGIGGKQMSSMQLPFWLQEIRRRITVIVTYPSSRISSRMQTLARQDDKTYKQKRGGL